MPLKIGVNLRVTGHCNQGGRKYMEDMFSVAYQQSSNDRELEYAFFGIFDGHGGGEAATFAKENLMDIIVKQKNFWSDNDEDVLKAIRDGYVNTHYAMWRELDKWPRTASGLPSTAGTTASIAFIRKGKIYIGHVGDSGIILGYQEKGDPFWKSKALTRDHKPECGAEMTRIQESGGKVVSKSGVPRVVWNRPRLGHKGPVRRSTHIDEIPFLAVARSLGDLWSYNSELNTFVVSPEPDVRVVKIDVKSHRCLIFGTDGLWNMLTPQAAVAIVQDAERHNEKHLIASQQTGHGQGDVQMWINPSKSLVDRALDRWSSTRLRADNTSVVTLMLDPPGPTHSEILLSQRREQMAPIRTPMPPVPETVEENILPSEPIHNLYPSGSYQPLSSPPEPIIYPFPTPPELPTYSEIQKHPDSSNHFLDEAVNKLLEDSSSCSKFLGFTSKEDVSSQSFADLSVLAQQMEESIQVAEISSSNVTDDQQQQTIEESSVETLIVEEETTEVESSLCVDGISTIEVDEEEEEEDEEEIDLLSDTKFLLERERWLENVPEAEKYEEENIAELHPIRFTEPQGPRLRRSANDSPSNSGLAKPMSSGATYRNVMRPTNSRRRHSTGAPPNNQRPQQRQRRSLTPKSMTVASSAAATYMSSGNKLKRSSKVLTESCDFDETRVGIGTRNVGDCKYEAKDSSVGEPCLKRRTRSEDLRNMQDENNPANQKLEHNRLRWPVNDTSISRTSGVLNCSTGGIQERRLSSPNSFKRRNLEKKVTPVKTIRRPSINRSTGRTIQMRENYWDQSRASRTGAACSGSRRQTVVGIISSIADSVASSSPKRWLRSDTIAATPIKTLRSRNVDIAGHTVPAQIAHQYGTIKPNRILEPVTPKMKQPQSTGGMLTNPSTPQIPVSAVTRVKSSSCVSTPSSTPTPNRTKQSCNVVPVGSSNSGSCVSSGSSSSSSSGSISKRAKTPYNPSARSLSTRSRVKRFSK